MQPTKHFAGRIRRNRPLVLISMPFDQPPIGCVVASQRL